MMFPRFSAEMSLYSRAGNYGAREPARAVSTAQRVLPADGFLCDWFPWLPWCPKPSTGVTCTHTNTQTACTGFIFWCKDNSICSDGTTRSSGWYPCGACFGFSW